MSVPALSIVVPTRNRRRILNRTLVPLLEQQGIAGDYEVIVVVDGSSDETLEMLQRPEWGTRLRVVSQPHRGLAAARNHGAMEARGAIVLFLDDDMIADPDLMAMHLQEHDAANQKVVLGALGLAAGVRRSFLKEGVAAWSRDMNRRLSEPGYRLRLDDWSFGNASVDRALFREAGGFDDPTATEADADTTQTDPTATEAGTAEALGPTRGRTVVRRRASTATCGPTDASSGSTTGRRWSATRTAPHSWSRA